MTAESRCQLGSSRDEWRQHRRFHLALMRGRLPERVVVLQQTAAARRRQPEAEAPSSWHRLRLSDLVVRRIGCWRITRPAQLHAEEDRVAPRVVQKIQDHDLLFYLGIGRR